MTISHQLWASLLTVSVVPAAVADDSKPTPLPPVVGRVVSFDDDVRPILTEHCYRCHGGAKERGGLKLDRHQSALAGGNGGAVIVPGKSADSRLIHALVGRDPEVPMPPGEGKQLTDAQIGILRAWIDQGAKWGTVTTAASTVEKPTHWAFQLPRRETINRSTNPIDHFIRTRLRKEGITPSLEADKATLLRRLSLDLTGLPPTPEQVDEFLADPSPMAYEKLVDRLLASEHYGERWARHWLDAARYADSDGYEKDTGRPFAWRYRDWVIDALNRDLPFDRFTVEQLAGDLLPNATIDQKTATGFHRNTLTNKEGGVDQEEFRVAAVVDRVNTTGTVWLGLTVGCCQCHDHKYDPLSHREYYQLFAVFNSDREVDLPAPLPGEAEKQVKAMKSFESKSAALQAAVEEAKERMLKDAEVKKREKELADHLKKKPDVSRVQTLALGPVRPTYVHIRGDFLRKGVEVTPGTPAVLPKPTSPISNRLDLANWIVSQENPLTPRVTVNWVWGKFFGRGLVSTPEDFGTQGQKPSHPELLDHLAVAFRDDLGWSLKKLHRLIVTSDTYKQASVTRHDLTEKDPLNVLLARQSRLRLEAEVVRDSALAVSGLLNRTVGGPSIRPPQPPGISELTYANAVKWVETTGSEKYKRGLYIWFQRTSPYPTLMTFDATDSNVCVVRRERSNTPLQALALLNDVAFVEAARALASRALTEQKGRAPGDVAQHAFRLCFGRDWTGDERERVLKLFGEFREMAEQSPDEAAKLAGAKRPDDVSAEELAAWVGVCRTLLNLDEFVTRE